MKAGYKYAFFGTASDINFTPGSDENVVGIRRSDIGVIW
jgi:hypothetical protein